MILLSGMITAWFANTQSKTTTVCAMLCSIHCRGYSNSIVNSQYRNDDTFLVRALLQHTPHETEINFHAWHHDCTVCLQIKYVYTIIHLDLIFQWHKQCCFLQSHVIRGTWSSPALLHVLEYRHLYGSLIRDYFISSRGHRGVKRTPRPCLIFSCYKSCSIDDEALA